jgi:hypothetical protein
MHQFFATHQTDLQYSFWGLTAIAILLGSKLGGILSKFPGLTRPGGFYTRLTIVFVLVGFLAALEYFYDRFTNHAGLRLTEQALQTPINEAEYVFGLAASVGLIYLAYPNLGKVELPGQTTTPHARIPT